MFRLPLCSFSSTPPATTTPPHPLSLRLSRSIARYDLHGDNPRCAAVLQRQNAEALADQEQLAALRKQVCVLLVPMVSLNF